MRKREATIIIIFAIAFLFLIIISFYYGIIRYWQSYRIASLICFMILFNCPILIGLLYFWGIKLKSAQWISIIFTLVYGTIIYIGYKTQYNTDLNKHGIVTHGVIYSYHADGEGQGFIAKVNFAYNGNMYESDIEFHNRDEFKIGDTIEVEFSSLHPHINLSRKKK